MNAKLRFRSVSSSQRKARDGRARATATAKFTGLGAGAALLVTLAACGVGGGGPAASEGGNGSPSGSGAGGGGGVGGVSTGSGTGGDIFGTSSVGPGSGSGGAGGENCGTTLKGIVRDFPVSHPDFEYIIGDDKGIVQTLLGMDGKPVYAGNPTTPTTTGKENFDQWFRDVPGVNIAIPYDVTLVPVGGGVYTYDNSAFFPIDGQGFGDEGNIHNYHFTLELRTQFEYKGGEVFTFTGDDDLFTFINGRLAINLGGVHGAQTQTVDLDAMAAELGISVGKTYPLDFFFAERHTSESNFRIDTTIGCFSAPPPS
jgi:fibro-slime domain-containing protein